MVKIELLGLAFFAYHGVHAKERKTGNNFEVDLLVEGDFNEAIETDKLAGTIDYEKLYTVVAEEMLVPSQLLEHLGGRIVNRIGKGHPEVKKIIIRIKKLNPPMDGKVKASRVTITRSFS